jgi:oxalate decarboxylase/phosphoglucose isomerase-like protein (cupin superfamily)
METIKKLKWDELKHEYGVDGQRLLPFGNREHPFPFGGAYCITRAGTESMPHINEPADEEEMFIAIAGKADVVVGDKTYQMEQGDVMYIPNGINHYVDNKTTVDFHFYALWWNQGIVTGYNRQKEMVNG